MFFMKNHAEAIREPFEFPVYEPLPFSVLAFETVDVDGKAVQVQVQRTFDPVRELNLDAVDFCLENQIASGNIVNLTHVKIDGSDPDLVAEQVEQLSKYISETSK